MHGVLCTWPLRVKVLMHMHKMKFKREQFSPQTAVEGRPWYCSTITCISLFFSLHFSGIVDRLKVIAKEREGIPLNDDVQEVFHLSEVVESILRHQQKGERTHNALCMQNRPATLGQLVSREKLVF